MSITVQFSVSMLKDYPSLTDEMTFENFRHIREFIQSYVLAPIYRMRSHENEFGSIVSREFLAVKDDGQEFYLGNIIMPGDKQ